MEGFIEDLYTIAAASLLTGKVRVLDVLSKEGRDKFRQPYSANIAQLFRTIGIPDIMQGMSWRRSNEDSVKSRLAGFVDLRNKLAHGGLEPVNKAKVQALRGFVQILAQHLDDKVADEITQVTGTGPW